MEIDGIPTLAQAFDLEQARRIRAEERVEQLEAALEDCLGNLDAGYSDTRAIARRGRAALKGDEAK